MYFLFCFYKTSIWNLKIFMIIRKIKYLGNLLFAEKLKWRAKGDV